MEKSLSYQDVYLVPRYSELRSRADADISVEFLGRKFKAPWLPSNMASVIDEKMALWLALNGYFYIYHRFGNTKDFIESLNAERSNLISISVGVKQVDKDLIQWLSKSIYNVDFITVDIAQGHSILMKEMIQFIRSKLPDVRIIAGNVATPEAVADLAKWGADAAKVGIGPSSVCTTKDQTGFHVPMFSCVKTCSDSMVFTYERPMLGFGCKDFSSPIPIISDGGCRTNGDVAKALVAGATMVMAGGMFAACIDAPGENVYKNRIYYSSEQGLGEITHKRFYGSASSKQKNSNSHVEGIELEIPCNGLTHAEKYQELTESLKSAVSYAGGKNLKAFKSVNYIVK